MARGGTPPRQLLLPLLAASAMALVFIVIYGARMDCVLGDRRGDDDVDSGEILDGVDDIDRYRYYYDSAPDRRARARHVQRIRSLRAELQQLQEEVERRRRQLQVVVAAAAANGSGSSSSSGGDYCRLLLEQKLAQSEVPPRVAARETEADVVPYVRFTATKMYPVLQGLGKRVVEKPIGAKREEFAEVIAAAVNFLNANASLHGQSAAVPLPPRRYQPSDFLEGMHRTQDAVGTHYELYFRSIGGESRFEAATVAATRRVTLFRPFGELAIVGVRERAREEIVNVVVSLSSGRLDSFARFLENFADRCIRHDKYLYLTVVYVGYDGLESAQELLQSFAVRHGYRQFSLEVADGAGGDGRNFSRGAALDQGVRAWRRSDDALVFLCDVDVVFGLDYLRRCRLNADAGASVYFPIVFSLYNPSVVYTMHGRPVPPAQQQLVVSADAGFWRDFGYGMACLYKSDFLRVDGFSGRDIEGWGVEDVLLYRKFVRLPDVAVVRATDPDIFHVYHEKKCDSTLPDEQYRGCIRSKALTEASHQQLGLLAFKNEIDLRNKQHRLGRV